MTGAVTDAAEDVQALRALEALFFVSDEPLTAAVLAQALDLDRRRADDLCAALQARLEDRGSGPRAARRRRRLAPLHPPRRRARSWSSSSCPRGRPA